MHEIARRSRAYRGKGGGVAEAAAVAEPLDISVFRARFAWPQSHHHRVLFLTCSYGIAMVVSDLGIVLALVGATGQCFQMTPYLKSNPFCCLLTTNRQSVVVWR